MTDRMIRMGRMDASISFAALLSFGIAQTFHSISIHPLVYAESKYVYSFGLARGAKKKCSGNNKTHFIVFVSQYHQHVSQFYFPPSSLLVSFLFPFIFCLFDEYADG